VARGVRAPPAPWPDRRPQEERLSTAAPLTSLAAVPTGAAREPPLTHIRPPRGWAGGDLRELWQFRELLAFLVWRDIKVRYKQTVIGAAWAIVQPVCTMIVFSLIFGGLAGITAEPAYPVFLYAGLLPWMLFSSAVTHASTSVVNQANLLTKVYFPRLFLPAAGSGVALVDFVLSFGVYIGIMAWYGHLPGPAVLLLPLLVVLTLVAALGVGTLLAALTVTYRDFRIVVPFLLQMWLYLSPIVYPPTLLPEGYRWLLQLNPLTGLLGAFRGALLNQPIDWAALGLSAGLSIMGLLVGVALFRRAERRFADLA
jgi:lipopolysaccharide transport system permease protein